MYQSLVGMLALSLVAAPAMAADGPPASEHRVHGAPATSAAESATPAAPGTDGEIRKVDAAAQKITVRHGPIANLGMAPMTMVFRVADPAFLTAFKPGDRVRMTVERVDGALTIVAMRHAPQ